MLKCLIIDDEQSCVDALGIILIKKFAEKVQILATETDPNKVHQLITQYNPDLIFLDIEMPQINGIALLHTLTGNNFQVIFTTAHQQYALQAIKLNALDYLLKPISVEELGEAIQKCVNRKQQQGAVLIDAFLEQYKTANATVKKISIATNDTTQFIPVREIIRIESQSNYSMVYFTSRPKLLVTKTLKEFEKQLLQFDFLRVHHSHLINMEHVIGYKNQDGGYVIMQGNDVIEISRRKKQEVLDRLHAI